MSAFLLEDRLTALVVGEGRHLFETVEDPRVRVATSAADAPAPDLIVCPCGHDRRFESIRSTPVFEQLRALVLAQQTGLILDASTEGVQHKPDITASLHELLQALGLSPRQCVYLTQDQGYERDYRAHCARIGAEPVAVRNHDYWIWHALKGFEAGGEQDYLSRLESFRARSSSRPRRFLSLNRTPRPIKILFLLRLLRDGLWEQGYISFGGFSRPGKPGKTKPTAEQLTQALPGFEDHVAALAPLLDPLDRYGRVLLGMERHGWTRLELWKAGLASDLAEYGESWFSAVTDTEMRPRVSRITEKVIKPLVNFHPMVVLGNPGALQMIRSYGFETFGEIFDESYDEELDPRRRFDLVYGEVERLCRLTEPEMRKLEATVAEKLVFNAHWGLTRFAAACRAERDGVLVDTILDAVSHTARSTSRLDRLNCRE
jgi:hypothetical protein